MAPVLFARLLPVLAVALALSVPVARADERILSFESDLQISADGGLRVTETLRVRAEGVSIRRGIYRDFPTLYRSAWGLKRKVAFEVEEVQRNGHPEPYAVEKLPRGRRVRIGQAEVFLPPGEHTYVLRYRTDRQIGFFAGHDELYWNVTGNEWEFPIDRAAARVVLPQAVAFTDLSAYTGPRGSKGTDFQSDSPREGVAEFQTTRTLEPGEGFTVAASFPKGIVQERPADLGFRSLARDNPGVFIGLLLLGAVGFYYLVAWMKVGRDPDPGLIIPRYGPPEGFSPAAVRYLQNMKFDNGCFTAGVIGLAVKGLLRIKETGKESYTLERTGQDTASLTADEKALFQALLANRESLPLKQSQHAVVGGAKTALAKALTAKLERTHFVKNLRYWLPAFLFSFVPLAVSLLDANQPGGALFMLVWLGIWTVAVAFLVSRTVSLFRSGQPGGGIFALLFTVPFFIGWLFGLGMLFLASSAATLVIFVGGAVLNILFYHLLKAPTHAGRKVMDLIDGFRGYLGVAESDRLNLENPPERTPQLFEQFLPYAYALDVGQEWSEKFSGILAEAAQEPGAERGPYRPAWYHGTHLGSFHQANFASSLGNSLSGALASSSTAPGSSSGSGGGGSSGGGGGGGGGGGW